MRHRTKKTKPVYLLNVGAALAPVGNTTIVTAPTVTAPTVTAPAAAATAKKAPPKKKTRFGRSRFSRKSASDRSTLSGLVVFDEFGRPFEANTAALTESTSSSLSQRGFDVLGLVSQQKTVDFDDGETAVLAWNAAGADGDVTSAMNMVSGDVEISIGIGSPHLFLAAIPSSIRVGEPQRFTQVMFSSLGEAGDIFDDAISVGFGTTLTDHLSANVFAVTESALDTETAGLALTDPQAESGTMSVRVPVGRELDGTVSYERRETSFDGSAMPLEADVTYLAETGYGTIGFSLDLVDTNVNGAGESGGSVGAGFAFSF